MSGPTLVIPAGDVREGDYLLMFMHFRSEAPEPRFVTNVRWNGRSRVEKKIVVGLRELVVHKDTMVLVHREALEPS